MKMKMAEPVVGYLISAASCGATREELEYIARERYGSHLNSFRFIGEPVDLKATYAYDVNYALHAKDEAVAPIVLEALSNVGRKMFS